MIVNKWMFAFGLVAALSGSNLIFHGLGWKDDDLPIFGWILLVVAVAMIGSSINDVKDDS